MSFENEIKAYFKETRHAKVSYNSFLCRNKTLIAEQLKDKSAGFVPAGGEGTPTDCVSDDFEGASASCVLVIIHELKNEKTSKAFWTSIKDMQRERLIKEKRTRIKRKVDLRSLDFFDQSTTNEGNEIMNLYNDGNPKKKLKGTAEVINTTLPQVQVQFNSNSDDFFMLKTKAKRHQPKLEKVRARACVSKTPPLRPRQVTVTTPEKPILHKNTLQYLAKHFSVHVNNQCVIMKVDHVDLIPKEIRIWISEKDLFESAITTSLNQTTVHPFQQVCKTILFDFFSMTDKGPLNRFIGERNTSELHQRYKELFPEFDFTLNKVDGIGSKVSSNKEIVFIEVSGGPENAVIKHVKEDTEKLIKEAMFGLISLLRGYLDKGDRITLSEVYLDKKHFYKISQIKSAMLPFSFDEVEKFMEVFELLYALIDGLKKQTRELKKLMLADPISNLPTIRDWIWVPKNLSMWEATEIIYEDFNYGGLNYEDLSYEVSDSSGSESTQENDQDGSKARNSASLKLPEAEVSISTSSHLVTISDNKSRPSISILPDDPEEKRKSVINKVLEQFPYLSSKYMLLYKKKDIIAVQEKLGINSNTLKQIEHEPDWKILADSYKLLLELVGDLIPIQGKLGIDINPVLEAELRRDKASSDKPIRLFDLLLCLEDDIATIQEELDIVGYTNQEMVEEADKNTRVYLRKFEEFHGSLEDDLGMLIKKFADIGGVKKFWFTGEGLPLFPNISPQQLHEIVAKKSASANQCPCLESK
ncbi:3252_t:CDS:10, partial [Ambispora gerdemannii]